MHKPCLLVLASPNHNQQDDNKAKEANEDALEDDLQPKVAHMPSAP